MIKNVTEDAVNFFSAGARRNCYIDAEFRPPIFNRVGGKDTSNCLEKSEENESFKPNQIAPSIYIMIELCYISLD